MTHFRIARPILRAPRTGRIRALAGAMAAWAILTGAAATEQDVPTTGSYRIHQARDARDLCRGEYSQGRLGDWVLDNALLRVVISARTGAVLDAAVPPDYLDAIGAAHLDRGLLGADPSLWLAPEFSILPTTGSATGALSVVRLPLEPPSFFRGTRASIT